jgi:hypothetical protein
MHAVRGRLGATLFLVLASLGSGFAPDASPADLAPAPNASVAPPARSPDGVWRAAFNLKAGELGRGVPKLRAWRSYLVDLPLLTATLERARQPKGAASGATTLTLPMPDGSYARFSVEESPLFSPELQARFPEIRTFSGQGIDDPSATAAIELSPSGFRAYVLADDETVVIDPAGDGKHYLSYWKKNVETEAFSCATEDPGPPAATLPQAFRQRKARPNGANVRTYRFAATLTGEYTTFFAGLGCPAGSPANCPQTAAAAALATTMNRVRGLFLRDTDVSFSVVATTIYANPATDPFTTGGTVDETLLTENQTDTDAVVGTNNYDIGHVFSQGGSGGSAPGRACAAGNKARGATSRANPSGDPYDVDFVAHEVGHQMSASHTWSGTAGSCSAGQFTATSAYEPGSGSTIMAYAGICGAENLQANSDAYFHQRSIDQITDFRNDAGTGGSCGTLANTGNTPPTINAGADFTIPRGTPFLLTAAGNDADGDALTFAWEQYDTGAQVGGIPPGTQTTGPLFRSFPPTPSASRTLPTLASLLGGAASPWEVLPTADRALTFRVTARDNRANGGGTDFDTMVVNVTGAPFTVTQPANGSNQQCGMAGTLAWQVGGGSIAPNVSADVSTDNGASFATLIGSTPNDGSEGFAVPRVLTSAGRIRVASIGNIFFNLSPRFNIVDTLAPGITAPSPRNAECASPAGTAVVLGAATATDACDFTPTIANNAPPLFPLGLSTVTWTATDDAGNSANATQLVTIVDTQAPVVTAPPNVTAECTGPAGTPVDIGLATAADVCDASLVIGNNAPPLFPLGTTPVTWSARDDSNNVGTAVQTVRIVDTTPPVLDVALTPNSLWAPNHKFETIAASISVTDVCDPNPQVRLISIVSDEPDNGLGDGDTTTDIQQAAFGTDDRSFLLRAERSGTGVGRIYTVTYEARDASGNASVQRAVVAVAHSQK